MCVSFLRQLKSNFLEIRSKTMCRRTLASMIYKRVRVFAQYTSTCESYTQTHNRRIIFLVRCRCVNLNTISFDLFTGRQTTNKSATEQPHRRPNRIIIEINHFRRLFSIYILFLFFTLTCTWPMYCCRSFNVFVMFPFMSCRWNRSIINLILVVFNFFKILSAVNWI